MFMLYVHVCAHMCRHPRGLEKGIGFPGTGVIGGCERPSVHKNWRGSVCFNHRAISPDPHKDLKRHFWERCSEVRRQGCFYCTSDLNNRNLLSYFWKLKVRNQDGGRVGSLKAMWKGLLRPLSMCCNNHLTLCLLAYCPPPPSKHVYLYALCLNVSFFWVHQSYWIKVHSKPYFCFFVLFCFYIALIVLGLTL